MGAVMSVTQAHRPSTRAYANGGRIAMLILIACLLVGCAQRDSNSEKDRPGGFYGGVSGGKGL
jgi:hypothetical protein